MLATAAAAAAAAAAAVQLLDCLTASAPHQAFTNDSNNTVT